MTLVVLGANAEVARAAATLPVDVVHVQLPGAPPLGAAAPVLTADFTDPTAFAGFVTRTLAPLSPASVVSLTERGLEPAALAAQQLGTPGPPPAVVRAMRDKLSMRRILAGRAPHLNPGFAPGDDPVAVRRLFAGHRPVVVKPVAGSGSQGVELFHALDDVPAARRTRDHLFEQYAAGTEFSVDCLSRGGRHTVIGIVEKGTTAGFVEVSHLMPALGLDGRRCRLVERSVVELLDALDLADGPTHTEVKVDGDRVTVIETHNRLGGDGIADLVRLTRGIDWRRSALGWAVGAGIPRQAITAPAAAVVFWTAAPGRVTAVAPRPMLAAATVIDWTVTVAVGDEVRPLLSSQDRLGRAVLVAPSPADCAAAVTELTSRRIVTTVHPELLPR